MHIKDEWKFHHCSLAICTGKCEFKKLTIVSSAFLFLWYLLILRFPLVTAASSLSRYIPNTVQVLSLPRGIRSLVGDKLDVTCLYFLCHRALDITCQTLPSPLANSTPENNFIEIKINTDIFKNSHRWIVEHCIKN